MKTTLFFLIATLTLLLTFSPTTAYIGHRTLLSSNGVSEDDNGDVKCRFIKVKENLKKFKTYLTSFDPEETPDFEHLKTVLNNITNDGRVCFDEIRQLINVDYKRVFVGLSTECVYDEGTVDYRSDPCCNANMTTIACCRPKRMFDEVPVFKGVKPLVNQVCRDGQKATSKIRVLRKVFEKRFQRCESRYERKKKNVFKFFENVETCYKKVYEAPEECDVDSDCSNGACDVDSGVCEKSEVTNSDPLVTCMFKQLPPILKREIRAQTGLNGTSSFQDVLRVFKRFIFKKKCLGRDAAAPASLNTKLKCEAVKVCSSNSTSKVCKGLGKFFCAGTCFDRVNNKTADPHCLTDASSFIKNRTVCETAGACLGQQSKFFVTGTSTPWNRTTCERPENSFCSLKSCRGCNRTECTSKGRCLRYPFKTDVCRFELRFDNMTGATYCPPKSKEHYPYGCFAFVNETVCDGLDGAYLQVPKTKEECESITLCDEGEGFFVPRSRSECQNCGGKYRSVFKWQKGRFLPAKFVRRFRWIKKKLINRFEWVDLVDFVKVRTLFNRLLSLDILPAYKSFVTCAYAPLLKTVKDIACLCSPDGEADPKNCIPELDSEIGEMNSYSNLTQEEEFEDFSVRIEAIKRKFDKFIIKFIREDLDLESFLPSFDFSLDTNVYPPVLLSQGYKLTSNEPVQGVKFCIKKSRIAPGIPLTHKIPGFAVRRGNEFVNSGVQVVDQNLGFETQMCGLVKSNATYFMAMFSNVTRPPGKPTCASPLTYCDFSNTCTVHPSSCFCKRKFDTKEATYCALKQDCVKDAKECVIEQDKCEKEGLVTCKVGSLEVCAQNKARCDFCARENKIPCLEEQRCDVSEAACKVVQRKCSDFDWVTCGTQVINNITRPRCAPTQLMCFLPPEQINCERFGWIKCKSTDNFCTPKKEFCSIDPCESKGLIQCPDKTCKKFKEQCGKTCVHPTGIQCPDGRCVSNNLDCVLGSCKEGLTRCLSGECTNTTTTPCCETNQFRCPVDKQCYYTVAECLKPYQSSCNATNNEFRCPNGECATKPRDCILSKKCPDSKPIRCADGTCRTSNGTCTCTAGKIWCPNLKACIKGGNHALCKPCPRGSFRCPTQGNCVDNLKSCNATDTLQCAPGLIFCVETRRCVSILERCSKTGCKYLCPPVNGTSAKCGTRIEECCTQGTVFCPKTGKCEPQSTFFTSCKLDNVKFCANNQTQCYDQSCVSDKKACPCPKDKIKCPEGNCVDKPEQCLENFSSALCGNKGVFCKTDGTCKARNDLCGSKKVCSRGYKNCFNGIDCIPSQTDASTCPLPVQCPKARSIFCRSSKTCVDSILKCPPNVRCPSGKVLCEDQTCKDTRDQCRTPIQCPASLFRCPYDGSCRKSYDDCPKGTICPINQVLCESGDCKLALALCKQVTKCPSDTVRCSDGSCKKSYFQCPTKRECPTGFVKCENGVCKKNQEQCASETISACPADKPHRCSGSLTCKADASMCPTTSSCPQDKPVKCYDGACVSEKSECKESIALCDDDQKLCPDGNCVPSDDVCTQASKCPSDRPIKCNDERTCVTSVDKCPAVSTCAADEFRCPNSQCVKSKLLCPTPKYCHPLLEKCWDNSCRFIGKCPSIKDFADCPTGFDVRCPNGACRKNPSDCSHAGIVCGKDFPYLCGTKCLSKSSDCTLNLALSKCNSTQRLCEDGFTCVDVGTKCPLRVTCTKEFPFRCEDGSCKKSPQGCISIDRNKDCDKYDRCWNGLCQSECPRQPNCTESEPVLCPNYECAVTRDNCTKTDSLCPPSQYPCVRLKRCTKDKATCEASIPKTCGNGLKTCPDGSCVQSLLQCLNDQGCKGNFVRCKEDGSCQASSSVCSSRTPKNCANGLKKCDDGSCVATSGTCPLKNGCPSSKPKFCSSTKTCVGSGTLCLPSTFCGEGYIKCDNGKCVKSVTSCVNPTRKQYLACSTSSSGRYPCYDGTCKKSKNECNPVPPCAEGEVRCGDNSCKTDSKLCRLANTCPSILPHRCSDGSCAKDSNSCRNEFGCPFSFPFRCTNGKCASDSTACETEDDILANGCKRKAPIRCTTTRSCVTSQSLCRLENGCSQELPVRCEKQGRCAETLGACSNFTDCTGVICPDGECQPTRLNCTLENGCSISQPYRCANDVCVSNRDECRPSVECDPSTPVLCADRSCKATEAECDPVEPCPAETPFLCTNGDCAVSEDRCDKKGCPPANPYFCSSKSTCMKSLKECIDPRVLCRKQNKIYCAIDKTCKKNFRECLLNLESCTISSFVNGEVKTVTLERCADGSCVRNIENCPNVPSCDSDNPFRCLDGSCVANKTLCVNDKNLTACAMPEKRCPDGICRRKCPRFDGCGAGLFRCPDFKCVENATDCSVCEDGKFLCWDNKCYDKRSDCRRPFKLLKAILEIKETTTVPLFSSDGSSATGESATIRGLSAGSFQQVVIESTDEDTQAEVGRKIVGSGKRICTKFVRFKPLDENGTEVSGTTQLNQATILKLKLLEVCRNLTQNNSTQNNSTGTFRNGRRVFFRVGVLNALKELIGEKIGEVDSDGYVTVELDHYSDYTVFEEAEVRCYTHVRRNVGETCQTGTPSGSDANNTVSCYPNAGCQQSTSTCVNQTADGASCTTSSSCTNGLLSGVSLTCVNSKCIYLRGFNESCATASECFSGICTDNKCYAKSSSSSNKTCSENKECLTFGSSEFYCSTETQECTEKVSSGSSCSATQPCKSGLSCVSGTCASNGAVGASCGTASSADCQTGLLCYPDNTCRAKYHNSLNGSCSTAAHCNETLSCNVDTKLCVSEAPCDSDTAASACQGEIQGQYCDCTSGTNAKGVCRNGGFKVPCQSERETYETCASTKCNYLSSGQSYPYTTGSCLNTNCKNEADNLQCCLKSSLGENFSSLPGFDSSCSSPTTQPTTQPTPEPSPSPSPEPSPSPSPSPTSEPTPQPSPSPSPTSEPTPQPSPSPSPTSEPTPQPSPTSEPTPGPSPTSEPTPQPTNNPTTKPTTQPTTKPTTKPTPTGRISMPVGKSSGSSKSITVTCILVAVVILSLF